MLTKGIEVMKYIRASAGRSGISVVFEDANQPRHDGKTIYLPRIVASTTELQLKQLMASTDHEVAHDRYSSFEVLQKKKLDPQGILMFVWNFLEDSRINYIEAKEYRGFKENWDDCSSILIEDILKKAKGQTSPAATLMTALFCWEVTLTGSIFPQIELVVSKSTPNKKILDVLNNFTDRLVDCYSILDKELGSEATYQLAVDILKELDEECKEELKPKPIKSKGDGKVAKPGGEEETTSSDSSKDKGDGGEKADPKDKEYKVVEIKVSEEDLENFSISMHNEDGSDMGKVGINFEPVKHKSGWDLTDYENFIVVDYPKQKSSADYYLVLKKHNRFLSEYRDQVEPKLVSQENFAQQVRKLIQIKARVQRQYGVKKGKLDQSRLSRICFDAPGFNERVFKNKIDNKTLDAAVTVLVDMSGSMNGMKAYYALASTLLVNEVCSTLNIPLEIVGFTDGKLNSYTDWCPTMYIYKSFSDLKVSSDKLKEYFEISSQWMVGNPDGENILWAHDRLLKRKEKKRLLVVMSDGSPAASKASAGIGRFTDTVIKEIEKAKAIDIYGLGLCSDSVKSYYQAHSVVNNPEEIPSKLLQLIERKIINV
jgi:cobalamin biosynthesis protein CobT